MLTRKVIFDVIIAPLATEKASFAQEYSKYVFKVAKDANKKAIQAAVEKVFNVKVSAVNVLNVKGKVKRFKGTKGKRADYKKAIVTLKQGDVIEANLGV